MNTLLTLPAALILACLTLASAKFECRYDHDMCPGAKLCVLGQCVDGVPTNGSCSSTKCPRMEACKHGACLKVSPDAKTKSFNDIECYLHTDCVGQALCILGFCKPAVPAGGDCDRDIDCLQNQGCKYGICMKESSGTTCRRHDDCFGPELCSQVGDCRPGRRVRSMCSIDSTCGKYGACKFGYCWKFEAYFSDTCSNDNQCVAGKVCDNGICVGGEPTDRRCNEDNDCMPLGVCSRGICFITTPIMDR